MSRVTVSDQAVLRYMQRVYGVDVEALRRHIGRRAATAAELGAIAVQVDGVKLLLRGSAVIATLPRQARPRWPDNST